MQKLQILIIILLTILVYSNIFSNEFATDDIGYFYNWEIPRTFANLPKIFTKNSVPIDEQGVYRPGKAFLIMLSHQLWGFNLFYYHLFSLLIHLGSTILVYFIAREMIKDKKSSIPFIAALLFGLHPIHTEAITFILASFDSAGLMFYLLAFWLYLRKKIIFSLIFTFIAFFTYEMTLTLPVIIFLYSFIFKKKNKYLVWYFLILFFYVFIRVIVLHIPPRGEYLGGDFYATMLLMTYSFVKYIYLLIWPVNLSLDHQIAPGVYSVIYKSYLDLKTLHSLSILNPEILANLAIIFLLIFITFKYYKKLPLVTFLIGWFFITLLPVSDIFPQGSIFAERYAYLPSFSFCLGAGLLFNFFYNRKFKKNTIFFKFLCILILFFILSGYGLRVYQRNFDWKDTLTVWQKLASQNPNYVIANLTLARIYLEKREYENAVFYFRKTLLLDPNLVEAKNNLIKYANHFKNNRFSFYYPVDWKVNETANLVRIVYKDGFHEILIEEVGLDRLSPEEYISENPISLPDFQRVVMRQYKDNGKVRIICFLFNKGQVIKVTFYPADLNLIGDFNQILGSIQSL